MLEDYESKEIRCPRLGGEVRFSYCRHESGNMPCTRTIQCWEAYFPVRQLLMADMAPQDWERFSEQQPKDKMTTLLDLIEAAKRRKQK